MQVFKKVLYQSRHLVLEGYQKGNDNVIWKDMKQGSKRVLDGCQESIKKGTKKVIGLINVGGLSQQEHVCNSISCWSDTMHKVS